MILLSETARPPNSKRRSKYSLLSVIGQTCYDKQTYRQINGDNT